jgi:DNA-binding NarL/FixJ family response regulator
MKKIRLLIADDHSIVRDGLRTLFRGTKEFSVVGEAADGETAVRFSIYPCRCSMASRPLAALNRSIRI